MSKSAGAFSSRVLLLCWVVCGVATLVACQEDDPVDRYPRALPPDVGDVLSTPDSEGSAPDGSGDHEEDAPVCERLFGILGPDSGLTDAQCGPTCGCGPDAWTPPTYTEAQIAALRSWTQLDAPVPQSVSPYETPELFVEQPSRRCGVVIEDPVARTYRTVTFESQEALEAAGARLTHEGACGMCSSLQDLAVYLDTPHLTGPVRACGVIGFREGAEASLACIADIGFSEACAQIWFHNTMHTREVCLTECVRLLNAPHHTPDGNLNACIQCDEDRSGPVFKAVAGRTRRNSSLPSGLCRPCTEIARIVHVYE